MPFATSVVILALLSPAQVAVRQERAAYAGNVRVECTLLTPAARAALVASARRYGGHGIHTCIDAAVALGGHPLGGARPGPLDRLEAIRPSVRGDRAAVILAGLDGVRTRRVRLRRVGARWLVDVGSEFVDGPVFAWVRVRDGVVRFHVCDDALPGSISVWIGDVRAPRRIVAAHSCSTHAVPLPPHTRRTVRVRVRDADGATAVAIVSA
jgi:hypothetical protein